MKITPEQVIRIIKKHGWNSVHQQTAVKDGEWVKEGSSFFEQVGDKDIYTIKEVKEWLGY